MAVKYLAGERIIGTAAERASLSTNLIEGTIFEESDTGTHYMYAVRNFDDKFVMRFKMTKVTFDGQSTFAGLSSTASSAGVDTNQDFVGIRFRPATSSELQGLGTDNVSPMDATTGAGTKGANANFTWGSDIFCEIIRNGTALTYEVFNNSDFAIGNRLGTNSMTMTGTITSLRYFKIGNLEAGQSGSSNIRLDDLELWASKTTASGTADYTYNFSSDPMVHTAGNTTRITVSSGRVNWHALSEYYINCSTIDIDPSAWHEVT